MESQIWCLRKFTKNAKCKSDHSSKCTLYNSAIRLDIQEEYIWSLQESRKSFNSTSYCTGLKLCNNTSNAKDETQRSWKEKLPNPKIEDLIERYNVGTDAWVIGLDKKFAYHSNVNLTNFTIAKCNNFTFMFMSMIGK